MRPGEPEESPFPLNCEKLKLQKKYKRHEIFDCLLSHLEGKSIRFNGRLWPLIFHPQTVESLVLSGWSIGEIEWLRRSIYSDIAGLRDFEVVQGIPQGLYYKLKSMGRTNLIFDNRIVQIPGKVTNALICQAIAETFSEGEL